MLSRHIFWMGESNAFLVPLHEANVDKKRLDSVYFKELIRCYSHFVGYVRIQLPVHGLIFPKLFHWGVCSVFGNQYILLQ